jgi:hypothetical protein
MGDQAKCALSKVFKIYQIFVTSRRNPVLILGQNFTSVDLLCEAIVLWHL